ncbi:MAG: class I SAM-dependent methyltransferase [Nostoc sp. S4]|nr:class I SAM-dependent methyltransferase [Nostoc sp. S4]
MEQNNLLLQTSLPVPCRHLPKAIGYSLFVSIQFIFTDSYPASYNKMIKFSDELINIWLEDGQHISKHYSQLVFKEGLTSSKSIGERNEQRNFKVFDKLFEDIVIHPDFSILDVGCGKGELLDYLTLQLPNINQLKYLGIDIVPALVSAAKQKFPLKEFEIKNFIQPDFCPKNKFDIVLALGVLVTKVREYNLLIEYILNQMVKYAKKYVLFNIISNIDPSSYNYSQPNAVGHSTVLSTNVLYSIIDSLDCYAYKVKPYNIFPDATDLFVCIQLDC